MSASDRRDMLWEPGKLWSLLDMLELKARPFAKAMHAVGWMTAMIKVTIQNQPDARDEMMSVRSIRDLKREMRSLKEACRALGATNAEGEADYILRQMKPDSLKWEEFGHLTEGMSRQLTREIQNTTAYAIEPHKVRYYGSASAVFGMEPVVGFPKAEYDLEEAGRCLALSRNTACVFHLMRAMELALQDLVRQLGQSNVDKRWGYLLADIDRWIKELPEERKGGWSLIRSNLWHVKETWRNDTMHPSDKYTDDEARDVVEAVKIFLRSLSKHRA